MYSDQLMAKWTLSTGLPTQNPCTARTRVTNPRRSWDQVRVLKTQSSPPVENGSPPRPKPKKSPFPTSTGPNVVRKGKKISLTVPDKVGGGRQLDAFAGGDIFANGNGLHQQTRSVGTSVLEREQREEIGKSGKGEVGSPTVKKPRLLCLHGYRTSADILRQQLKKWPPAVLGRLDLDFLDAPFIAQESSDVEGVFDPPYYEWFQFDEEFTEYYNFEEAVAYIEDHMIKNGPYDGLLGFSQGGIIAAAIPGMQANGVAFTTVPKIKHLIVICGGKMGGTTLPKVSSDGFLGHIGSPKLAADAFSSPVDCPSLHIIAEKDYFMRMPGTELVDSFVDPYVIKHRLGHTVTRPNADAMEKILSYIEKIEKM